MDKYRIALITPYFGEWPRWFGLYLYSCSRNPDIDFIFFTDCKIPQRIYNNTRFYSMTFQEYCDDVSRKLGIDFHPARSYKLCDLKPFLGVIHEDILEEYVPFLMASVSAVLLVVIAYMADITDSDNVCSLLLYAFVIEIILTILIAFVVLRKDEREAMCNLIKARREKIWSRWIQ